MKILTKMLASAFLVLSANANAALLTPVSFSAPASVNNSVNAGNNVFPSEWGQWQTNTAWWTGTAPIITFSYSQVFNIEDILLSVDNNDNYSVEYSLDNSTWTNLFNISSSYGEVGWGMDTMSTLSGHPEYIAALDFAPVQAQFLRIFATGGDNSYSVGEFQAFGSAVSAVPVPAAAFLFAPALMGFLGFRRKLKNTVA
jgi:hypothetical protein